MALIIFAVLFNMYTEQLEEEKRLEEKLAAEMESTVPEEERIAVPDPEYFFGVEELVFEEFPDEAADAYYNLLVEKYGFVIQNPELPAEFRRLEDSETGKYSLFVLAFRNADGLVYVSMNFSDYCREEALETWDGNISEYLYRQENWTNCDICGGTGDCQTCNGRGYTLDSFGDDYSCRDCKDGECGECYDGKVKVKRWEEMTDEEKMEEDWKRVAREYLNR